MRVRSSNRSSHLFSVAAIELATSQTIAFFGCRAVPIPFRQFAIMSIVARNCFRTSTRSLSLKAPLSAACRATSRASAPSFGLKFEPLRQTAALSTSVKLSMSAPGPAPGRAEPRPEAAQYDQEIVDMADYIHNYQVKSDLAVRIRVRHFTGRQQMLTARPRSTLPVSSSSTP